MTIDSHSVMWDSPLREHCFTWVQGFKFRISRRARVTSDLGDIDPPAFHIEGSTTDAKSYAVDLHTAFREVVFTTVGTHRTREFDGFVASLWAIYLRVHMHLYSCTKMYLSVTHVWLF